MLPTAADLAPLPEGIAPGPLAPESAPALAPAAAASAPVRQTLRVSVERLDKVLNLVGELVTAKIRLSQIARNRALKDLSEALLQVDHVVNELQEEVTAARMVPMDQIFSRFPRLMRDLSRELGKPMELTLEGKDIELDRSILDEIGEVLVHMLRNAADHGIEGPEERRRLGKPATGTVRLEARRDKNQVLISVEDDGGGVRLDKVRSSAVRKGLLSREQADALDEEQALALIFSPGFSTAEQVTAVSGRGVGMDAVKSKVESLGGNLRLENFPGQGSRFRIRLPLTLAIIQALRVRMGDEEYMAPVANVVEAVEFERGDLGHTHGLETVKLRDEVLPVTRLRGLIGMDSSQLPANFTVLVAESGERRAGLMVDEVLGQQEIAIKSMGKTLKGIRGFGGVTILGDGTVCLILDLPSLLDL
jgi:two-component system chemotaxis sensor kinase CheA